MDKAPITNWTASPAYSEDLAEGIMRKWHEGQEAYATSPLYHSTREYLALYHCQNPDTGMRHTDHIRVTEEGQVMVDIGELRSLTDQNVLTILQALTEGQPVPGNTDSKTISDTRLAKFILRAYRALPEVQLFKRRLVERTHAFGIAFGHVPWDQQLGDEVLTDDEESFEYQGDFEFNVGDPRNVVWDRLSKRRPRWYIVTEWVNRWDLAEQYSHNTEVQQAILEETNEFQSQAEEDFRGLLSEEEPICKDDYIQVAYLYVDRSPSLPGGRKTMMTASKVIIDDLFGDSGVGVELGLDYPNVPVFPLVQADSLVANWPYAVAHDWIVPIKLYQAMEARFATKALNKTQVLGIPASASYDEDALHDRCVVTVASVEEMPMVQEFGGVTPDDVKNVEHYREMAQRLAVVSSASRGEREGTSKVHDEMLKKAQIAFAGGFAWRVASTISQIETHLIKTLALKAEPSRMVSMVGVRNTTESMEFTEGDLSSISQVVVKVEDGRSMELANMLLQGGMIKQGDLATFMRIAEFGLTEIEDEADAEEEIRVRKENEWFLTGEGPEPVVAVGDPHERDVVRHLRSARSSEARHDPEIIARHMKHVQEHLQHLMPDNPNLPNIVYYLLLTGQKPLPSRMELLGGLPGHQSIGQQAPPGANPSEPGKSPQAAPSPAPDKQSPEPGDGPSPPKTGNQAPQTQAATPGA